MTIKERLSALRARMLFHGITLYVVPSDDDHQSEYVGEHDKERAFITGFTGSAGTALISQDMAGLWTDGRYFIQAKEQLAGSGITLFRMGEPEVPTLPAYVKDHLHPGDVLGFFGQTISAREGKELSDIAREKNASLQTGVDLIDEIWTDRPPRSQKKAGRLPLSLTGETTAEKLQRVRAYMEQVGANVHLIASLDDICWLTNLRGDDIAYSPLVLCFALLTPTRMNLYVDPDKINSALVQTLEEDAISVCPYEQIYADLSTLSDTDHILVDPTRLSYTLMSGLPEGATILTEENPEVLMKSRKNDLELKNIRAAHVKDGVAVTRFMYWMKNQIGKKDMTEISAAEKLEAFRQEQEGYLGPSFAPICASGAHGAIVHYEATPETNCPIAKDSLFLNDTGGHYRDGSTDITRTFCLGTLTDQMKDDYTAVLKGHLRLARCVFPHGTTGYNLDALARAPLWEKRCDFRHGTGHGVGNLLCIHEGPCRISPRAVTGEHAVLETGMVLSDEPGIYREGAYGIRIENLLVVQEDEKNADGQFLHFEPLTLVPIDLDGVQVSALSQEDKDQLNGYHARVYQALAPLLPQEEADWLKTYTRAI